MKLNIYFHINIECTLPKFICMLYYYTSQKLSCIYCVLEKEKKKQLQYMYYYLFFNFFKFFPTFSWILINFHLTKIFLKFSSNIAVKSNHG